MFYCSEFEELEAVPTMAVMDGPLEPSSSTSSNVADVPDDPSFVNFFSLEVSTRGLRQGDPLSPFLFTIVANVLSMMLLRVEERGILEGFLVGRNRIRVTHLQFADDTLFFANARAIPSYFLSMYKIPSSTVTKFEKMQRNFLRLGYGEGKRDHLISWIQVCKQRWKEGCGLGAFP
ncbi:putative mitochondrial protein [Vitis vinifera]|uniref:Putative mitochondrial protein n=1 Tax=Vitis vinifera TaxID=29760 RepID=A0A438DD64_VITVI|nr:putative mitochondrial protein [Vitis vinifera]